MNQSNNSSHPNENLHVEVSINKPAAYWCNLLGCERKELFQALRAVGTNCKDLELYFSRRKS